MRLEADSFTDLPMDGGVMRVHVLRPQAEGRFPAILLYSEIYQVTAPIRRTAAYLAATAFSSASPKSITNTRRRARCWPMTSRARIAAMS